MRPARHTIVSRSAFGPDRITRCVGDVLQTFDRVCGNLYLPSDFDEQSVAEFYDGLADSYESHIDLDFNLKLISHLLAAVSKSSSARTDVLDYGIGPGLSRLLLDEYPNVNLHGADISNRMVILANRSGIPTVQCSSRIGRDPFPAGSFDGVFAANVAHYFRDTAPFLLWARLLRLGGRIAFNARLRTVSPTRRERRDYMSALAACGFVRISDEIIEIRSAQRRYNVWVIRATKGPTSVPCQPQCVPPIPIPE
ncbi:MAG: class I SAM-dependent methyltransferase [Patescibacteria group bacterium]